MSNTTVHNWPVETFHYEPNKNWAMAAAAGYGIILNVIGYRIWRRKSYWGWIAPTAAGLLATGFSVRYYGRKETDILALNVINNVLIVAPVAGYLIFNYVVYGKIMEAFATGRPGKYSLVKPELAIRVLTLCDLVSFTAQGGGAGLRATLDHQNTGRIIFLIGVIVHNVTYGLFVALLVYSHRAFHLDARFDKDTFPFKLFFVLYISSLCITARAGYRFMELIQGNDGNLVTHEKWLYMFDVIPLANAIGIYAIFWPGSLIGNAQSAAEYSSIDLQTAPRALSESRDRLYP